MRRLIPTAVIGLICTIWFVDHRMMSTKTPSSNGVADVQTLPTNRPSDETVQKIAVTRVDAAALDKTIAEMTATIPSKPTTTKPFQRLVLKTMKNVAVRPEPTSIGGLLR